MLIVERTSNGQTIITFKRDWHPSRMSKSYTPPRPRYHISKDAWDIQTGLLNNPIVRKQS
jgi:hypothetical protein